MVRTTSAENAAAAEREKQTGGEDEGSSSLKRGRGKGTSNAAAVHSGIPKAPEAAGGSPNADGAAAAPQKKPRLVEGAEGEHRSPVKAGKAKGKGASKQQGTAADEVKDEVAQETDQKQENPATGGTEGSSKRRAATQGNKAYKDGGPTVRTSKNDVVVIKEEATCPSEAAALEETGGSAGGAKRRLLDFAIVDGKGNAQPLERALLLPEPTFLTGVICPALETGAPQKGTNGSKERERGRRVEKDLFGPLKEWRVAYTKSGPQVVLKTASALYECVRPSASYRKLFGQLEEQLDICHQVYLALCPDVGGNLRSSYEEVVAKLARTKVAKGYGSVREALLVNAKFVLSQLEAMTASAPIARNAPDYRNTPFGEAMAAEVAKGLYVSRTMTNGVCIRDPQQEAPKKSSGDARADALAEADEEMARRLQSKMDAQAFGGGGGGRKSSAAPAYIRISEQEIADDYPLPKQYNKEVDETDELLMADPDDLMDVEPDLLPRRMLHDFAFYNAEGFLSSLELVPMFTGVDHDVDIFGSGIVAEEDEADFTAGGVATHVAAVEQQHQQQQQRQQQQAQRAEGGSSGAGGSGSGAGGSGSGSAANGVGASGAGGSGAGGSGAGGGGAGGSGSSGGAAAPATAGTAGGSGSSGAAGAASAAAAAAAQPEAKPEGMRVFLSQIREWCVECSCDMLFISIRTDVAWYRLIKPAEQYAPWYATVLKAAQVAVAILGMLEEESRASRLSFSDIARRLAELPESAPAFLSKKAEGVQRFVVVHGQIILNQFRHYPNKAVQRAAFTTELKRNMETRKHHKLYMSKAKTLKIAKAPRNANPMRTRAASGLRAKPMPATATTMVKAVWHNYFFGNSVAAQLAKQAEAAADGGGAAADGPAKEVEEDENEEEEETGEENALAGSAKNSTAARRVAQSLAQKKQQQQEKEQPADAGPRSSSSAAAGSGKKASQHKLAKVAKRTIEWSGKGEKDAKAASRTLYSAAKVGDLTVQLGDVVCLPAEDADEEGAVAAAAAAAAAAGIPEADSLLGLVVCLFEEDGEKMVQVRVMLHGHETVLGDVAADCELFLTESTEVHALADILGKCGAKRLEREWKWENRVRYSKEDEELRKRNEEHRSAQQPLEYVYRHLYRPEHGMFCAIPPQMLPAQGQPGKFEEDPEEPIALGLLPGGAGFTKEGVEYRLGDFIYLHPQTFESLEEEEKSAAAAAAATKSDGSKAASRSRGSNGSSCAKKGSSGRKKGAADAESSSDEEEEEEEEDEQELQQEEQRGKGGKRGARGGTRAGKGKAGEKLPEAAAAEGGKKAGGRKRGADGATKEQEQQEKENNGGVAAAALKKGAKTGDAAGKGDNGQPGAQDKEEKGGRKGGSRATRHKGSHEGLKAFCIGQLVSVEGKGKVPTALTFRRLFRPEEVSQDLAYRAGWWDLYMSAPGSDLMEVDPDMVVSKCEAVLLGEEKRLGDDGTGVHTFRVVATLDPAKPKDLGPPPTSLRLDNPKAGASSSKGKGTPKKAEQQPNASAAAGASAGAGGGGGIASGPSAVAMRSLDIFAGCGGLSEGMHQAGVAESRWAIEYEQPAADAFKLNYPDAKVFCNNCNVLLMAAMAKANLLEDCDACNDCMEAVAKLPQDYIADLPSPGDVEFMMGGPPCQGYSGMNRFNKGNWSLVQNSMVMAYLSYCDFFRPRYFLLENVRNFVSHNKSFTFRLTLRTLLDMGYQVRFGVLNAGNYGVPQSRKRTIIWAAAPNETLPEWPKQQHVFHSPQLTVNLPGGVAYTAVPHPPGNGAPLRAVTVRDAIADLPRIENGCNTQEQAYGGDAESAYQHFVRGSCTTLRDHVCKEMNELNLERCRCIPKNQPGADWRVLMDIVASDESRKEYKGQALVPWCLPNTMDRHNGWRGLFGRLDLHGHFPTSTTDPQPMGKVGQVFHPTQDRIVSVRECARSQGFPDSFSFAGNVHNKHRQVGNAVPPPLACALGKQLRVVLEAKRKERISAALAAQW